MTDKGLCSSQTAFLLLQCRAQEREWRAARSYTLATDENRRLTETFARNFVTDTNGQQQFAADTALFSSAYSLMAAVGSLPLAKKFQHSTSMYTSGKIIFSK